MRRQIVQAVACLSICACLVLLSSSFGMAQQDTVEFKLIPKYYPETDFIEIPPPEIVFKPDILFPNDPTLQGEQARVYVNVLINRKGNVTDAKVWKSTNKVFDKYALTYAKQYKFRLTDEAVQRLERKGKFKGVWVSIPILFKS